MVEESQPTHLDPSELGTKEYWDEYYERDLNADDQEDDVDEQGSGVEDGQAEPPPDPSELDSWFDDVGAPQKTLAFLTSTTFPLSPKNPRPEKPQVDQLADSEVAPTVLDLGTGNGSALFSLRLQGGYCGSMLGVDYSQRSVELANKLRSQYASHSHSHSSAPEIENIEFEVYDIINDSPQSQPWWPKSAQGFDLVLDKGTFDAISLSSATVHDPVTNAEQRIYELYPAKVLKLVRPGGFLLVTSCNWTEKEVVTWFTGASGRDSGRESGGDATSGRFEVFHSIKYPVFEFGGQKGQGVASVCFRKTAEN